MSSKKQDAEGSQERYRVGCSGWSYEDWVGPFYPKEAKPKDYLRLYSSVFDSVEIDSSFYRIPNQSMVAQWKKNTPENFVFCPKFPKKITHEYKLENVSSSLGFFYKTLAGLDAKLGPLVVQLPPSFKYDKGYPVLEKFLSSEAKTKAFRHAIEFRHKSWFREDVYDLLRSNGVSLCWSMNQYASSPLELTSNFIYARLVGERDITKFSETQKDRSKEMKEMASAVKDSMGSVDDAFVFFNNHFAGFGPESVNEFRRLLGLMEMKLSPSLTPMVGSDQTPSTGQTGERQLSLGEF